MVRPACCSFGPGLAWPLLLLAEIPFTSLSAILPFILVGIGVDDMVSSLPPPPHP